jgi:hypothetical protein
MLVLFETAAGYALFKVSFSVAVPTDSSSHIIPL